MCCAAYETILCRRCQSVQCYLCFDCSSSTASAVVFDVRLLLLFVAGSSGSFSFRPLWCCCCSFSSFFHFVVCGVGCEGVQVAVVQENDNQLTTLPNTQTPFIIVFKFLLLLLFSYSCCRCLHIVVVVVVLQIFPAGVSFHLR